MAINTFLTCPADCDENLVLGATTDNQDCTNYQLEYSQIFALIILPDGASLPSDWTSVSAWASVIDNTISGNTKGRYIVGEGSIPKAEGEEVEYPGRKSRIVSKEYSLSLDVKNVDSLAQYNFLKQLQCGVTDYKVWIETVGGRLFGGPSGIDINGLDSDFPKSGGRDDKALAIVSVKWEADGDPLRTDISGLAAAISNVETQPTVLQDNSGNVLEDNSGNVLGIF